MERKYFECTCSTIEHMLVFEYDWEDKELYASIYLEKAPFLTRLINAAKYVCGIHVPFGHFGSWILKPRDKQNLINFINMCRDK